MCGLAELLAARGYEISGSDRREGPALERLRQLGIPVQVGHDAARLPTAQAVVVSSAVPPDNPELREARRRGIPVVRRGEMLAELMRPAEGIAVAGTHGKTTTASLVAHLLSEAGLDPSAVVGGRGIGPAAERTGTRVGKGALLVAEADESDASFLLLSPVLAVITHVEAEHLDCYGSEAALRRARNVAADGWITNRPAFAVKLRSGSRRTD